MSVKNDIRAEYFNFDEDLDTNKEIGFGIHIRGDYSINDKWFLTPGFTYVIPSSNSGFVFFIIIPFVSYRFIKFAFLINKRVSNA